MASSPKTALVTGGAQGIGAELARLLAADGYDLIVVARSGQALAALSDELRALYGVSVRTALVDLAQPHAAERLWSDVVGSASVDVLVNNAGVGLQGSFAEHDAGALQPALCPGPTKTGFAERSGARRTVLYRWVTGPSAAAVARAGYRGLMRGRAVVIPGLVAKLVAFAGELPPRRIALEVNRLLLGGS